MLLLSLGFSETSKARTAGSGPLLRILYTFLAICFCTALLAGFPGYAAAQESSLFPVADEKSLNGDFEERARRRDLAQGWEAWPSGQTDTYYRDGDAGIGGSGALLISDPALSSGCGAHQRLELRQSKAVPLYYSIYSREIRPARRSKTALTYGAQLKVTYGDGSEESFSAFFGSSGSANPGSGETAGWMHLDGYIWPAYAGGKPGMAKAIKFLDIYLVYSGQGGSVAFDRLSLRQLRADLDAVRPLRSPTRLLVYSTMNPAYAAANGGKWAATGIDGFMFDHGQLLLGDNPRAAADEVEFKQKVAELAGYGIDRNFLLLQNRRGTGPDFSDVFDDAAWRSLLSSLGESARYAKSTGLRGLVLDMEPVISKRQPRSMLAYYPDSGKTEAQCAEQLFKRGRQVMSSLEEQFPGLEVILLPHLSEHDSGLYRFYGDFFAGMAAAASAGPQQIVVGEERSQTSWKLPGFRVDDIVDDEGSAARRALDAHAETAQLSWPLDSNLALNPAPTASWRRLEPRGKAAFWAGRAEIYGDEDLGSPYVDKSAKYRPDYFYRQLETMTTRLPQARYLWIYDHGSSLLQMSPAELEAYGPQGRWPDKGLKWAYRGRVDFARQPVDPFLDYYFCVTRRFFGADDPL